jgi:hypothetical protein
MVFASSNIASSLLRSIFLVGFKFYLILLVKLQMDPIHSCEKELNETVFRLLQISIDHRILEHVPFVDLDGIEDVNFLWR